MSSLLRVVDSYIRWYNEKRIKISLGSLSPLEYRASLGLEAKTSPRFMSQPRWVSIQLVRTNAHAGQLLNDAMLSRFGASVTPAQVLNMTAIHAYNSLAV